MRKAAILQLLACTLLFALASLISTASFAAITSGTIRGTVTAGGSPISGVNIRLFSPGVKTPVDATKTDSNGTYEFTGVTPGDYQVTTDLVGYKDVTTNVSVVQEITSTTDFALVKNTAATGTTILRGNTIRRGDTTTTYTVSQKDEQEREPNPTASYQFPGLVVGVPGVTFDPSGGYVHLRGSDENAVGFQVDGISNTDASDNQFTTNIVSVGLKDANVEIGGQSPSVGGELGGAINEVTKDGRDLVKPGKSFGGMISNEDAPGHGWNYTGSEDEIGGVVGDKFDYYASTVVFRNRFPNNYNGLTALPDSYDGLYKVNYYADKNDKFTAYYGKGNEEYEQALGYDPYQFQRSANNVVDVKPNFIDHQMQSYKTAYFAYQRKLTNKSFIALKIDNNPEHIDLYDNSNAGEGGYIDYNKTVNDLSYQNQITSKYRLDAGYQYTPEHDRERIVVTNGDVGAPTVGYAASPNGAMGGGSVLAAFGGAAYAASSYANVNGFYEEDSDITYKRNAFYVNNQIKPLGNKLTFDLGARQESLQYNTHLEGKFTKNALDPRVGATFSPSRDFLIRSSLSVTSQFADGRRIEYLGPGAFDGSLATDTSGQGAAGEFVNRLRYNDSKPDASHSNNFDLGLEKAFNVAKLPFAVSLTGFQAIRYNLLQYDRVNPLTGAEGYYNGSVTGAPLPIGPNGSNVGAKRTYDSIGRGNASGVEFQLTKKANGLYDQKVNGFLTYTNQTVKQTNSFFDSAYIPYAYEAYFGAAGITTQQFKNAIHTEYPVSWDQKHTVFAELNKRVGKVLNFHVNLDAGSGYPYVIGVSGSGLTGGGQTPTVDSQHTSNPGGAFASVPILLPNGQLQPINATPGFTGWHYKFTFNTDFDVSPSTTLFFNMDNPFDRKTTTIYSTVDAHGNPFYSAPTFAHPQGQVYYGSNTILLPVYISFGFRQKF